MARNGKLDLRSADAEQYRALYKTARWQRIRKAQLSAFPLCQTCERQGRITPATVCNHLNKAAKATVDGFFAGPFSSECKTCHDGPIQRDERRADAGLAPTAQIGEDGWPVSPGHPWSR